MKNSIALLLAICFTYTLSAQSFVDKHYSDLMDDERSTVVFVSGKLFDFAGYVDVQNEDEEVKNIKKMITSIEAFSLVKSDHLSDPIAEYKKGVQSISSDYEELVRVRDKQNNVSLHIDEEDGVVYEIIALASTENNEFIAASLLGEIDLEQVSKIVSKFQEEGMPLLTDIDELELEDVKVYPNPVQSNARVTLEVGESLIGGTVRVIDLNGKVMSTYDITQSNTQISTDDLIDGQYFVEATKENVSVKKQIIVLR